MRREEDGKARRSGSAAPVPEGSLPVLLLVALLLLVLLVLTVLLILVLILVLVVLRHEGTPPFGVLQCGCGQRRNGPSSPVQALFLPER